MTNETAGGFTVDLWKAVAADAGLNYTIHVRPFRQILQEFKEGKIDVLINLAISDERRQFADLTVPHVIVNGAIFVRKGESSIRSEDDFSGKSIIVLNADLGHDYAVSKGWQKQLVLVDTSADGFRLLASGKHDAMLLSKLTGMQTVQALGLTNIEAIKAKAGFSQKFAFAVHKGQSDLLATLNEGMAITKSDGTYNALYEKWFGVYETKEVGLRDLLKYIIPVALVFIVILGYFFYQRQRERQASEAKLRTLFTAIEQSPASVVITDLDACIQYVNPKFADVTGYTADEAIGQNPRILKSGQMKKEIYVQLWDTLANGKPWHGELINKRKNGEVYWEDVHIAPVMNRTGDPSAYVALKTDITERKQAEEAMRDSEERLRLALDAATMAAWKWDVTSGQTTWGDDPQLLLGPRPADGYPDFREMVMAEDRELFFAASQKALQGSGDYEVEFRLRRTDGKVAWLFARGRVKRDGGAEPIAVTGVSQDITERKQAELEVLRLNAQLKVLATTDQLTGLMNRRHLTEILDHEVIRMARYDKRFSVILMDVDHFKSVNDRHGHQVGDDVLIQISGILAGHVRAVDRAGRWGGEEFLVICPETTLDGAANLAELMRQRIEQYDFAIPAAISASFGVAASQPGMTAEALMKAADDALYRAKTMGRNRVVSTTHREQP